MAGPLHIVGNVVRSIALIALLFAILFGLVFAGTWLVEAARLSFKADTGLITERAQSTMLWLTPYVVVAGIVWIAVSLIWSGYLIRWSSNCRIVEPGTEPRLEGILKRVCQRAGMDVPQLGVIDSDELNAYATGIFKSDHLVAVTRGLAAKLDDLEVEAVMAHELAHIKNKDVMLAVIAGAVAGGVALLAQMLFFALTRSVCAVARLACGDEEGDTIGWWVAMVVGFVLVLFASLVTTLIEFALSRSREYLADAGAAEITGNPRALITSLQKISDDCDIGAPAGVMQMCIDRPRGWLDLFSTHPATEDRIAALREMPQRVSGATSRAAGAPQRVTRVGVPPGLPVRAQFGQRTR